MPTTKRHRLRVAADRDRLDALYPFAGLAVALICVAAGVGLFLLKATGEAVWDGSFMMVRLHIDTAAPGVVCFVVALVIVYLSRPNAR